MVSRTLTVGVCFPLPFPLLTTVVVEVLVLGMLDVPELVGSCFIWVFCKLVFPFVTVAGVFTTVVLFGGTDLRL